MEMTDVMPTTEMTTENDHLQATQTTLENMTSTPYSQTNIQRPHMAENNDTDEPYSTVDNTTMNGTTVATKTDKDKSLHPLITISRRLFLVVIPIITIVGTVGNCLMLVVMQRPSQKKSPVSVFMSALAVADTVVLILDFINNWINFVSSIHLKSSSVEFCRFHNFVFSTTFTYCAWLVVCVSVQRLIVVWFPLQARSLCTTKKAIITVCLLPFPCALLQSYNVFIWKMNDEGRCGLDDNYNFFNQNVQAWLSAVVYSYLPVVILIVSNACLIGKLVAAQMARKSMGAEKMETMQITLSVVVVCVFFVLLTVPLTLFYAIIYYLDQFLQRAPSMELGRTIILILGLSNHAINFFLYVLTSAKFRQELRTLCRRGSRAGSYKDNSKSSVSFEPSTAITVSTPSNSASTHM